MDFDPSPRCSEFKERLTAFMDAHVYPAESVYERQLAESGDAHHQPQIMEELKVRAREAGLWNMFLPDPDHGAGLSNADYAPLAEILGRSHIASEACNCSAPDTGNMEVLHQFASPEQKERWLVPLLDGEIRSAFAMTEPDVASSDATNIAMRIERDGEDYVLNGRKWWTSGAYHPHARIMIVMGKTQTDGPRHRQQSMILVPFDTPGVTISESGPLADIDRGVFDIVDLSADFLDTAETNATAFSREAIVSYLRMLAPHGMVSIPVSIRDFPVYALRMLATVRAALLSAGIDDPAAHVLVYRSAWNVRILIARDGWSVARIEAAKKFCDDRSFDLAWYPGMDVTKARAGIYNDLPAVSFDTGEVASDGPDDAIADEAQAVLSGQASPSRDQFNLSPITLDRPFFYAVLRLDRIGTILKRLEILPQAEVGALVNLAVLAQAAVIAALVLLVPLLAPGRIRAPGAGLLRAVGYFPALALGFLFIEIYLIEKASFWLTDRTSGFALVLTGMLICSGLGSLLTERFGGRPRQFMALAALVVLLWSAAAAAFLQPVVLATLDWPFPARAVLLLGLIAPVSVALGLPFPLGLKQTGSSGFLPWAWGLNGAFSVVATPLANLIAREEGFMWVLLCAAILYGIAVITFPAMRKTSVWHDIPAPSPVAE